MSKRTVVCLTLLVLLLPLAANFLRGGPAPWQTDTATCAAPFGSAVAAAPESLPFRPMPLWEQVLAVVCGFGVKAVYMLLSVALLVYLRRRREADLRALQVCLMSFFAGEAFCAINYFGFGERSYLFEYLHSFGMVIAFAAFLYFVMELVDLRVLHFSSASPACAFAPLCRGCTRLQPGEPCLVRRLQLWGLPLLAVLAVMPLTSSFRTEAYTTRILGTRYLYQHAVAHQLYEIRDLPVMALALIAAAWLRLRREPHPMPQARLLFAAAVGMMAFSWFRWVLLSAFAQHQLWFVAWEEITELLFILGVLVLLVLCPALRRSATLDAPAAHAAR